MGWVADFLNKLFDVEESPSPLEEVLEKRELSEESEMEFYAEIEAIDNEIQEKNRGT